MGYWYSICCSARWTDLQRQDGFRVMLSVAVGLFMILVVSEMMMYGDVDVSCFMRSQLDSYEWHEYERLKEFFANRVS